MPMHDKARAAQAILRQLQDSDNSNDRVRLVQKLCDLLPDCAFAYTKPWGLVVHYPQGKHLYNRLPHVVTQFASYVEEVFADGSAYVHKDRNGTQAHKIPKTTFKGEFKVGKPPVPAEARTAYARMLDED